MIGYTTIGSNDLPKAWAFYDELFETIGASRLMEIDTFVAWGVAMDQPLFSVTKPFNGEPATVGNGDMVALFMPDTDTVSDFHAKALSLGASNEGKPGDRGDNFYGAYFRDLDGHKICAFTITE
ncbi:MAG: VOC family protein [Cellvibrionaceae bacterium]|nr:VOC family protein [Cellvibrionaceae bacterium]MCV6626779.1 VOC family protein [Cellvibrionaceae bacterium]